MIFFLLFEFHTRKSACFVIEFIKERASLVSFPSFRSLSRIY